MIKKVMNKIGKLILDIGYEAVTMIFGALIAAAVFKRVKNGDPRDEIISGIIKENK